MRICNPGAECRSSVFMFPIGILEPDDVKLLRRLMDWHKYALLYEYTESAIKEMMDAAQE